MAQQSEGRFDQLPVVSEAVSERVLQEIAEFSKLHEEAKKEQVEQDLDELREKNNELYTAITTGVQAMLEVDPLPDQLTYREWKDLEHRLLFAFMVVLRALNEAWRERHG